MAENNVVLTPLKIKSKLAPAPTAEPRYSIQIKNRAGQTVTVADPRATRALVALMDMHAVNGGAASHWGGPSAFAEISAAAHAIMFSVKDRAWFDAYHFVNDAGHAENGIYAIRANYGFGSVHVRFPHSGAQHATRFGAECEFDGDAVVTACEPTGARTQV